MKKLPLFLSLGVILSACGQPPTTQIAAAQDAVNTAITSGAQEYAEDVLKQAQDALNEANNQVSARNYPAAKTAAVEAKAKAEAAKAGVEAGKERAKAELAAKIEALKAEAQAVNTLALKTKNRADINQSAGLREQAGSLRLELDAGKFRAGLDKAQALEKTIATLKAKVEAAAKPAAKKAGGKRK